MSFASHFRYERVNNIKQLNPKLKTLLSVGGWNMGSEPFMAMVETNTTRKTFIDDAIIYLRRRNFDGLDIDWEYPANRGSPPEDKQRYSALIRVSYNLLVLYRQEDCLLTD